MRTVGFLLIPAFPLACERCTRSELREMAAVVAHPEDRTVWAASELALRRGARPGQPLREAESLIPTLAVIEARPARYRRLMERLLTRLETVVPVVSPQEEGMVLLDLGGQEQRCALDTLAATVLAAIPGVLEPRLGIASSPFVARAAAHTASPLTTVAIADADVPGFLAAQPLTVLPVGTELIRRFHLIGLTTLGDVARLPRRAVLAEFGHEGVRAWSLARGQDGTDLRPRVRRETIVETLELESPVATREALGLAVEHAVRRACSSPRFRGRSARQAVLRLTTERGALSERVTTFKEAIADRAELRRLVGLALHHLEPSGPVAEVTVELTELVSAAGWQRRLDIGQGLREEHLDEGLRTLRARYGRCPIAQVTALEPGSRLPERRWVLVDRDP